MKRPKILVLSALFILSVFSISLLAGAEKEIQKTYEKKKEVRLKLVLGDCQITNSSDGKIHVHLVYDYENIRFEPVMEEKGRYLYLREKMHGNNPQGYSRWALAVPNDAEIDFSTATGELSISGQTVKIEGKTGTGDIELTQAKGDFDLSTGTGNLYVMDSEGEFDLKSGTGRVSIRNSKGNIDASSGTGNVDVQQITLVDFGEFSSGTGDAEVSFPEGEGFDLTISSGTDKAVLDMKGKPVQGYFEFTANARRGRIVCPFSFDKEEELQENDNKYVKKSFTKGKDTPKIYVKTGTGRAEIKR